MPDPSESPSDRKNQPSSKISSGMADEPTRVFDDSLRDESMASADTGPIDISENMSIFQSSVEETSTQTVGRYQIESKLGAGGFGEVLLATDSDLRRRVAIKIPFKERVSGPEDIQRFLDEARVVALLEHPGVVPIYDFGHFEDRCYVVSKYIEGGTLSDRLERDELSLEQIVKMLHTIAKTLDFIHEAGVIHRDIKPANLLLGEEDHCYVTDFGLAIHDNSLMRGPGRVGTVAYMSPEQARGESHLVDGRSDLFSVGVVMYEMLTGKRPFIAKNWQQTLELICKDDPIAPREVDASIPKELERICLKLLSKQAGARYDRAIDLADDLGFIQENGHDFSYSKRDLQNPSGEQVADSADQLSGIVPRGLRCFDREDADYFRKLLPGPCDRSGLPDSLRFWKRRVETESSLEAFRIGVIYGSSGSGKSSFAKAGLLPTLANDIVKIVIDASADRTEKQLLAALRAACPELPVTLALVESVTWIRTHDLNLPGRKVLIVIDQFEQWLHAWNGNASAVLTLALRQCDGVTLQCILLVRDDYWVGVSRLAELCDVDLVRSENLAMIDLFDKRHARTVLAEYGRGYARLPDNFSKLNKDQNAFLDQAVDGLAIDGKIVPVQLVTFAEIMKSRPWTVRSIEGIGGIEGVGIRFLDEALGANAPAENRSHADAVQRVLKSLLPDAGSNIKGSMRSERELNEISGYENQPRRFGQMISILDQDLRLITPTDRGETTEESRRYFQLSHDFLVPAIRNWLQRNQRLTLRGRAAMRLADRADVWTTRSDSGHLPSWLEWLSFLTFTKRSRWDEGEQRLMKTATRKHVIVTTFGLALVLLLGWFSFDQFGKSQTHGLAQQLATASATEAEGVLDQLDHYRRWSDEPLSQLADSRSADTTAGLRARLALLRHGSARQATFDEVAAQLTEAKLADVPLIQKELRSHPRRPEVIDQLWEVLNNPGMPDAQRLKAAMVLANYDPPNRIDQTNSETPSRWDNASTTISNLLIQRTIDRPSDYPLLVDAFQESAEAIWKPLFDLYLSQVESSERQKARSLITDLFQDNPDRLIEAFFNGDEKQAETFLPSLEELPIETIVSMAKAALSTNPTLQQTPDEQQLVSNRQVNAAALLFRFGAPQQCWDLLKYSSIPNTRSGLIERAAQFEVDANLLLERLKIETDPGIRSAILLMLGTKGKHQLKNGALSNSIALARDIFLNAPEADVHSASLWALHQLANETNETNDLSWIRQQTSRLSKKVFPPRFGWTVNSHGQTFVRLPRDKGMLEIATSEVTMEQYKKSNKNPKIPEDKAPYQSCPVILRTWYQAVEYCRWLTFEEGMTEADQCHPPNFKERPLYEDYEKRGGYRLLTPQEWEAACFGNSVTRFAMGHDYSLLQKYGWTLYGDFNMTVQPVETKKPLPTGIFGAYGNVMEWCTDTKWPSSNDVEGQTQPIRGVKLFITEEDVAGTTREGRLLPETVFYSVGFRICRAVELP